MGLAILFITHDIALARKVSDRMAVMRKGRIVEEGATNEILISPSPSPIPEGSWIVLRADMRQ